MGLSKLSARCRACPFVEKCDCKRMEACGYLPYAETASMPAASSAAQLVLREAVEIHVNGQPQRVYMDEIEKILTEGLYAHIGLQYGA